VLTEETYNPYSGGITNSTNQLVKPPELEPIKLDKATFSPEAQALKDGSKAESIMSRHTKFKGYA